MIRMRVDGPARLLGTCCFVLGVFLGTVWLAGQVFVRADVRFAAFASLFAAVGLGILYAGGCPVHLGASRAAGIELGVRRDVAIRAHPCGSLDIASVELQEYPRCSVRPRRMVTGPELAHLLVDTDSVVDSFMQRSYLRSSGERFSGGATGVGRLLTVAVPAYSPLWSESVAAVVEKHTLPYAASPSRHERFHPFLDRLRFFRLRRGCVSRSYCLFPV